MKHLRELRQPSFIIGTAIGLLGILAGYYFYEKSEKERVLAFASPQDPAVIYDKSKSDESIKILYEDSLVIEGNVYLALATVWNAGELEIERQHLRVPLEIGIPSCKRILSAAIATSDSIIKVELQQRDSIIQVTWEHFDPGMRLDIQIIYEADQARGLIYTAKLAPPSRIAMGTFQRKTSWAGVLVSLVWPILNTMFLIEYAPETYRRLGSYKAQERRQRLWTIQAAILIVGLVFTLIFYTFVFLLPRVNDVMVPTPPGR